MSDSSSIRNRLLGAAFLMATSAIGPGFITQTVFYTRQLGASMGFVILVSVLIDVVVQLNLWHAIAASGMKAPQLASRVLPGSGLVLAGMVVLGGLVFNVGNVAGCGLGLQAMLGMPVHIAAAVSGVLAMIIFLVKEFGQTMDAFAKALGLLMIGMMVYVAWHTQPPLGEMAYRSLWPESIDAKAILTLVGGTVGGYISFAGAHRMLDAGGAQPSQVNRAASTGILVSGVMRLALFAAAFGVLNSGFSPDEANPAASVFRQALGNTGLRVFGLILWCAAITSVVGASYTSVTFLEHVHPAVGRHRRWFIVGFIALATVLFMATGSPVRILVTAGAINGLVLPLALALMMLALRSPVLMKGYRHPLWLQLAGWLAVVGVAFLSWQTIRVWLAA